MYFCCCSYFFYPAGNTIFEDGSFFKKYRIRIMKSRYFYGEPGRKFKTFQSDFPCFSGIEPVTNPFIFYKQFCLISFKINLQETVVERFGIFQFNCITFLFIIFRFKMIMSNCLGENCIILVPCKFIGISIVDISVRNNRKRWITY